MQITNCHQTGPTKQKKVILKNKNLDTICNDDFGDKNKAGKESNLGMKQGINDSIPKKKQTHKKI